MEDEKKYGDGTTPGEERYTDTDLADSGFAAEGAGSHYAEGIEQPIESDARAEPPAEDVPADPPTEDTPVEPSTKDVPVRSAPKGDLLLIDADCLKQIDGRLESIAGSGQRLFSEVREMHKLYHTEFAGRLKAMQDELEQYRKIDKGRAYDDILAAIARIYGNNETLAEEVAEPKAKKSIWYMLMDIEDLLNVYGMTKQRSSQGEKRNPRHCQVLNRIPADDPAKHDTVAKSYNSGFYIGNRTIIKEMVDVYIYEGQAPAKEAGEEQFIEAGDMLAAE